jgi:hypothetical protein
MWSWKSRRISSDFPTGFSVQRIRLTDANAIADRPPPDIATYFREHPEDAQSLLVESSDKRFTPSSFIEEKGGEFRVGWFSSRFEHECTRQFSNLPDAATDYLLFSLGKGRWTPPDAGSS